MNNKLEWIWKEVVVAYLRCYPGICLDGLTKNFSQDSRSRGRDLNPGPSKNKVGVLTTRSGRSVIRSITKQFTKKLVRKIKQSLLRCTTFMSVFDVLWCIFNETQGNIYPTVCPMMVSFAPIDLFLE
jgi:hypothetical protein